MKNKLKKSDIEKITGADIQNPFLYLGPHKIKTAEGEYVIIRAFIPNTRKVNIVSQKYTPAIYLMHRIEKTDLFETITDQKEFFPYKIEVEWKKGIKDIEYDPYSFPQTISEEEQTLFKEGKHYSAYDTLGAHRKSINGVEGIRFALWAPNARRVSVVGDFNYWDGRRHMMRLLGKSGIWEIFIPSLKDGEKYKFELKVKGGGVNIKSDPYARQAELRPKTASIISNTDDWEWGDKKWLAKRKNTDLLERPLSTYEVHLGSWHKNEEDGSFLNYRDIAPLLAKYVKKIGYTHIELMPIQEHPFDGSWGYQVTGYFAPTSRFGTSEDFLYFVDHLHRHNIGVIMDWVPAHFPVDEHSLGKFDDTCLYEYSDPRRGKHKEWGTLVFNFGQREVINFLISNVMFWCRKYHIDGIRVDAVSSMLYLDYGRTNGDATTNIYGGNENLEAIEFLKEMNIVIHDEFPGIVTIAEESTAWPGVSRPTYLGGLGFTLKWNMGWMNDMLAYMSKDPVHRKHHHNDLTFSFIYAFHENFILAISHDEVVHGKASLLSKMPGDDWQKFANLRLFLGYMFAHPGKKSLFMGIEIGQWKEWNHDNTLDWGLLNHNRHKKLKKYMTDLNALYKSEPTFWELDFCKEGIEWIDSHDWEGSILSYVRKGKDKNEYIICIFNFTPIPRIDYRIGVPEKGEYEEILNSNSKKYDGTGLTNPKLVTKAIPWQDRPHSLQITLSPLGAIFLKIVNPQNSTLNKKRRN